MNVLYAPVGARVVDSLPFSQAGTGGQALALKAAGVDGVALYLGVAKNAQLAACIDAGLFVFGVTLAGKFDGKSAVKQAQELGMPAGVTLFLDVEGPKAFATPAVDLMASINGWANDVQAAAYNAGLYVGVPQPLTSEQLWQLRVSRYWRGQGSVRDKDDHLAEPKMCGWCMTQMWPSQMCGGVLVDFNMVGADYLKRTPRVATR